MKKTVFLSLILLIVFSGCLLQPQITIKSALVEGDLIKVNLNSNKQVNVEVQLSDESDLILCSKEVSLTQGSNDVALECSSSTSNIKVTVFVDGAVFSQKLELEFGEGDVESRVIFLAETNTIEGEALKVIEKGMAKQNTCNAQMYIQNFKKYYQISSEYSGASSFDLDEIFDNMTSEQLNNLDEQINTTKTCNMVVEKKVTDFGSGKYTVSYSWVGKGDCYYAGSVGGQTRQFEDQKDILVVEVNLKDNSAKATSGLMTTTGLTDEEQARAMIKAFDALGGCIKALMLGVSPIAPGVEPPEPRIKEGIKSGCSFLSGNIEIKSFAIEKEYIILHLMNITDDDIQITSITGSPVELTCYACTPNLKPGAYNIMNLQGDFSASLYEETEEQLTISYTKNGMDFSEKADCRGIVGNFIEEMEDNAEQEAVKQQIGGGNSGMVEINPDLNISDDNSS